MNPTECDLQTDTDKCRFGVMPYRNQRGLIWYLEVGRITTLSPGGLVGETVRSFPSKLDILVLRIFQNHPAGSDLHSSIWVFARD